MICVSVVVYGVTMTDREPQMEDDAFWSALRLEGDEVESYTTFASMTQESDRIVRGSFDGDVGIRLIQGDAPEDQVFMAVLGLVDEERRTDEPIRVEFVLPAVDVASAERTTRRLTESLPDGPVVAFLRLKMGEGDGTNPLYRLVSSEGIWVETTNGLYNPLRETTGQSFGPDRTLTDLAG